MGSTNGTYVNGNRAKEPVVLAEDDLVQFANLPFRVRVQSTEETPHTVRESAGDRSLALVLFDKLMSERAVTPFVQPIGYRLDLDLTKSTPETNAWRLYMHSEDSEDTLLCTKSVPKTRSLSAAELLKRVRQGYDEVLARNPCDDSAHQCKIQLLLRFDKVREARQACKAMLSRMPEDWWANLVCALVMAEEQSDEKAEQFLAAWVKRNPNFFSYLDLAYTQNRVFAISAQPRKGWCRVIA